MVQIDPVDGALSDLPVGVGWIDADAAMREAVTGIVRAGADAVLSYAAIDLATFWAQA